MSKDTNLVIQSTDKSGVVTLTLNDPAIYNALSHHMLTQLHQALTSLSECKTCRVIVIQGAGRGFCAGHNLKELLTIKDDAQALFNLCSQVMLAVERSPKPVIAKVHGAAFAAGCQLVASCDLAIAANDAVFATPGVNIGLFCSTPMVPLSRSVSKKHALEMLFTGEGISAEKAEKIGLINRTVESDKLDECVRHTAEKIASKSAHSLNVGKAAFYRQLPLSLDDAYALTSETMSCNMRTHDANEGISAFLGKRTPQWQDK